MKWVSQHISALVLVFFVAMITDLAGLYEAIAANDANASVMTACHRSEMPADGEHDEPCEPASVLPCHMCAILDLALLEAPAEELEILESSAPQTHEDAFIAADPDPPKFSLF